MSGIVYFKRAFENIASMEAHKYVFNCVIILSVLEILYLIHLNLNNNVIKLIILSNFFILRQFFYSYNSH